MDTISVITREEVDNRPVVLFKIGGKDLFGESLPWIPSEADLNNLQRHLDTIAGDRYRFICYHQGVEVQTIVGEEADIKVVEITELKDFQEFLEGK
jgi:hypothetical protein